MIDVIKNLKNKLIIITGLVISFFGFTTFISYAEDIGFSDIDILELRATTAIPRYLIKSFSSTLDQNIGKIELFDYANDGIYLSLVSITGSILVALLLWQLILFLIGKQKLDKVLYNLFVTIVMPSLYLGVMLSIIAITNALIQGLTNGSFSDQVNKNIYYFITVASESKQEQNFAQSTLNNLSNLIFKALPFGGGVAEAVIKAPVTQFKFVANVLGWAYFITAIWSWFSMFIVDWFLKFLFMLSPIVAVSHIMGWGNGFIKKFWAAFIDCIIAKLAFHIVYYAVAASINSSLDSNIKGVNVGFALFSIFSMFSMNILVLKIRGLFDFVDTTYNSIDNGGHSQNITQNIQTVANTAITTVTSLRGIKK